MNITLFPAVAAEWRAQQRSRELWSLRKKRFCNCERRRMQFVFLSQKSPVRRESGFYSVRHSVKKPKVNLPNTAQEHFVTKARKEPFLVCFVLLFPVGNKVNLISYFAASISRCPCCLVSRIGLPAPWGQIDETVQSIIKKTSQELEIAEREHTYMGRSGRLNIRNALLPISL